MKLKKVNLGNLSGDGQRKKRALLALKKKNKQDIKEYQKKRYAKIKKANEEWKGWFR